MAVALTDLGVMVGERGALARAAALIAESLDIWLRTGNREGVADSLANLATIAAAGGQPEQAARLFGASAALADAVGYAFELPERLPNERAMTEVKATMGDAAFTAAWNAGRDLSLDCAVAEALAVRPTASEPMDAVPTGVADPSAGLSPREVEVLRRLVAGATNREIAAELFISPRTVQSHMTNIFGKLGVGTRSAAVAYAYQHKLV
jgi:DNA-binding CsgD family transcriptional regulator